MAGSRDPLLGRERERSILTGALDDVIAGSGRLVMVTGEAGIGKSRLFDDVAQRGREAGLLVLTGRAAEFEGDVPFAVVIDAFDAYLRTLEERDLERLAIDQLGALAAVFPALRDLGSAVDVPINSAERFRVHRAVAELIERLAARQPVLLLIDDLQWADHASLELAAYLARRPPDAAVMTAFAARPGAVSDDVTRMLADIHRNDQVITIEVPPLPPDALRELVGADREAGARLHRLTGGNPFFALQLARSGSAYGAADSDDPIDVPAAVARSIELELAALPDAVVTIAAAAAVVGDPFELDLTVAASEQPEGAVLDAVDQLARHGVIRSADRPRRFQFRHPLVRSAVYQATLPGTRIACHRRLADHLAARRSRPVDLARHVEHSARHGDLDAISVLESAAESVIATAPVSAARWYSTALSLLPHTERPQRRIALLGGLARAKGAVGDLETGLIALRESLSIVPAQHHRARTTVAIACSEGERILGRPDLAAKTLRDAYAKLDDHESTDAVRLAVALSTTSLFLADNEGMLHWGEEAERVATGLGDEGLRVAALAARTAGAALTGEIHLARQLHQQVCPLLDRLSDDELAGQLDVVGNLALAELYMDLYEPSLRHALRGLAIARRTGQTHLMPALLPSAGTSAWMLGEVATSIEILDDAIEAGRLVHNDSSLAWHLFNRALPSMVVGDVEAAAVFSAESWRLAEPLAESVVRAWSATIQAEVLHAMGQHAEAVRLMHECAGGPELTSIGGGWRCMYLELLARCHIGLGDVAAARDAAERARSHAAVVPLEIALMCADRATALVAIADGDPATAVECARSALAHAQRLGSPPQVSWCRETLGSALAAAGDVDAAAESFQQASREFDARGAIRYRDRADAELRRLGQTVHRRSVAGDRRGSGLDTLTGRELEVAELIHDRRTNREIAEELFLSLKTVETHVRNIFHKLDVTSRVEIARAIDSARPVAT